LEYSNGFIAIRNTTGLALDSQFANAWLNAMADESGSTLPRKKEQLSTSPSLTPVSGSVPRRLTLLLAEDNLPDALLVGEVIQMAGLPLELHVEPDGEQAWEFFRRAERDASAPRPHLLLLDLNLPKVDGIALLRRLREREEWKNLPVMVITSSDAPEDRNDAARLGASYFRKPANYDAFLKLGDELQKFLEDKGLLPLDGGVPQ
jgi:CheY-like chemotaxis protein